MNDQTAPVTLSTHRFKLMFSLTPVVGVAPPKRAANGSSGSNAPAPPLNDNRPSPCPQDPLYWLATSWSIPSIPAISQHLPASPGISRKWQRGRFAISSGLIRVVWQRNAPFSLDFPIGSSRFSPTFSYHVFNNDLSDVSNNVFNETFIETVSDESKSFQICFVFILPNDFLPSEPFVEVLWGSRQTNVLPEIPFDILGRSLRFSHPHNIKYLKQRSPLFLSFSRRAFERTDCVSIFSCSINSCMLTWLAIRILQILHVRSSPSHSTSLPPTPHPVPPYPQSQSIQLQKSSWDVCITAWTARIH